MISKNLKILKKIIKNYYIKTKIINEIEQHFNPKIYNEFH